MDFATEYDIGVNKPSIPETVLHNWQDFVDILARVTVARSSPWTNRAGGPASPLNCLFGNRVTTRRLGYER